MRKRNRFLIVLFASACVSRPVVAQQPSYVDENYRPKRVKKCIELLEQG